MKRKPNGAKYRNLTARKGVIYYQRRAAGKRIRFSCNTDDWQEAAAVARLYEEKKGIGRLPFATVEVPRFREFVDRYLEEDTGHLAPTTLTDRRRYLDPNGQLLTALASLRLDLQVEALDPIPTFPVTSVRELADRIAFEEPRLRVVWRDAPQLYEPGWVPKHSGRWRRIWMPDDLLKAVQRTIARRILGPLVESPIAYGIQERSHIDAARLHTRQPYVGTVDIEKFFDSVTDEFVQSLLARMGCNADLVELLVDILTFRGSLPQGAPTSPAVAGLLLVASDHRLHEEALRLGVVLTRYVDDYAISGRHLQAVREMMRLIELELRRLGLRSNPSKRTVRRRSEPPVVHGLNVNNGVSVPKPYRNAVRAAVYRASREGCTEKRFRKLAGQVGYIAQLHPKEARKLHQTLCLAEIADAQALRGLVPKEAA